ncbi:Protein of unknown function [Pyronema omphalodes CBS 100304]|uniref:Uncharacterized protein n=1 Tax=Pyronema omphalodes (strain CBS 100304) TaxID=1076935 RepID=U4LX05_PYROM|nr:Protein of unknown function [Pyronema omphalodes CBS 100304]
MAMLHRYSTSISALSSSCSREGNLGIGSKLLLFNFPQQTHSDKLHEH